MKKILLTTVGIIALCGIAHAQPGKGPYGPGPVPCAYTNCTVIGLATTGLITTTLNAAGLQINSITNSSTSTNGGAGLQASNGTSAGTLYQFGTGNTLGGIFLPNGTMLQANGAGGLTLATTTTNPIVVAVNNTAVGQFNSTGIEDIGGLNVTGSTVPANGVYLSSANTVSLSANGSARLSLNSAALFDPANAGGLQLTLGAANCTTRPTLVPAHNATTYGIGGDGSTKVCVVINGVDLADFASGGLTVNAALLATSITAGSANAIGFTSRGKITSPADGVLLALNNAGTSFTRLQFGGTTSSFFGLGVSGTTVILAAADGTTPTYASCTALTTNASGVVGCTASDRDLKHPRGRISNAVDLLAKIPAAQLFTYKDTKRFDAKEHIGLYAQDVCNAVPDACAVRKVNGKTEYNYEDRAVISLLVKAVQEQKAANDNLSARIARLERRK